MDHITVPKIEVHDSMVTLERTRKRVRSSESVRRRREGQRREERHEQHHGAVLSDSAGRRAASSAGSLHVERALRRPGRICQIVEPRTVWFFPFTSLQRRDEHSADAVEVVGEHLHRRGGTAGDAGRATCPTHRQARCRDAVIHARYDVRGDPETPDRASGGRRTPFRPPRIGPLAQRRCGGRQGSNIVSGISSQYVSLMKRRYPRARSSCNAAGSVTSMPFLPGPARLRLDVLTTTKGTPIGSLPLTR